jgi:hypothetical protein
MLKALQYYMDCTRKGIWNKPDAKDEKIMALTAALQKNTSGNRKNENNNGKGKGKKQNGEGKHNKNKKGSDKLPKWCIMPPNEGESNTKTYKNKMIYWCPTHSQWVAHHPEECKGYGTNKDSKNESNNYNNKPSNEKNDSPKKNEKRLQRAFQVNVDSSDDEE